MEIWRINFKCEPNHIRYHVKVNIICGKEGTVITWNNPEFRNCVACAYRLLHIQTTDSGMLMSHHVLKYWEPLTSSPAPEFPLLFNMSTVFIFSVLVVVSVTLKSARRIMIQQVTGYITGSYIIKWVVLYCIVLYWWSGHCCPMHCDLFKICCAAPNLGITRTWICRLNFAQRPIF